MYANSDVLTISTCSYRQAGQLTHQPAWLNIVALTLSLLPPPPPPQKKKKNNNKNNNKETNTYFYITDEPISGLVQSCLLNRAVNPLVPERWGYNIELAYSTSYRDRYLDAARPHWWLVNSCSGNGLVPSCTNTEQDLWRPSGVTNYSGLTISLPKELLPYFKIKIQYHDFWSVVYWTTQLISL